MKKDNTWKLLVKQGDEYFLVLQNHNITRRKISLGLFEILPRKDTKLCLQSFYKGRKRPAKRIHKYTFETGDFPANVFCKVMIRKK